MSPLIIYPEGFAVTCPKEWFPVEVDTGSGVTGIKPWTLDYTDVIKKSPRICLDLDGVVCVYDFPRMIKEDFGIDIRSEDIYTYDIDDILGVTKEAVIAMFMKRVYDPAICEPGALNTLNEWIAKGYEIFIYSNRINLIGTTALLLWLNDNDIPFTSLTRGLKNEYDLHIDDRPPKLAATNSRYKMLYHRPWNDKCLDIKNQFRVVYNWKEIKERADMIFY